jgi:formylglycine-generating enzyme
MRASLIVVMGLVVCVSAAVAPAGIYIPTVPIVPIGGMANPADVHGALYGAVGYEYRMGKYEVTAGQYCAFLNAVARNITTDTYGLYNASGLSNVAGCKIRRSGSAGNYSYLVDANGDGIEDADRINRPVNFVKFSAAMRFANWMANGQPTTLGMPDLTTTEDGSYYLNGANTVAALQSIVRKTSGATWVLPTNDEWYKAAFYHDSANVYYDWATGDDAAPGRDMTETTSPGNNANFTGTPVPIDSGTYYTTVGGEFELSYSPYGTFDQAGNVSEWSESIDLPSNRRLWGGSYNSGAASGTTSPGTGGVNATGSTIQGFRLAIVPEPGTLALLLFGGLALIRRR